ncbi:MAG TPA: type II toxin-antitoxin system PemK/MazF family toxin [Pseudonocardiaceae bacterium]|jgi:mRNA-degrading endonuclease toxin of MazEF toxin-antitoxin module
MCGVDRRADLDRTAVGIVSPGDRSRGHQDRVMIEQLAVIDPQTRFGEFAGRLNGAEMQAVSAALLTVLVLD